MKKYRFTSPIDMPRGSHYGNNYWTFKSKKVGRVVTAFSNLEYYNLITLEMDPNIEYYCEQPYEAELFMDGVRSKTIFDVWVCYCNGYDEFQEVKYSSDLDEETGNERTISQIEKQMKWCRENNFDYIIRTEKDIHAGKYYLSNLMYLQPKMNRISDVNKDAQDALFRLVSEQFVTIGDVMANKIFPEWAEMDCLALLFYQGKIDLKQIKNSPINMKTEILLGKTAGRRSQYEEQITISRGNASNQKRLAAYTSGSTSGEVP